MPEPLRPLEGKVFSVGEYFSALMSGGYSAKSKPWPVERAVSEGYERVVWAFAAVEAIANNQARLDYRVMDGDEEVDGHPLARLLNDGRANPWRPAGSSGIASPRRSCCPRRARSLK
ncbi:hypothetical protein ACFQHO_52990 [Actinomadura yumaensis]|uniref:hypothetical protein n=1 Tax=Actinomadura yumaensis TaxID=111807 RepID=UPI00360E1CD6